MRVRDGGWERRRRVEKVVRRTYCSDSLGDTNCSGDTKDLPEEVEQDALFRKLEEGFVALDKAGFADEVEDFGHDAVAFETAPLFYGTAISTACEGSHRDDLRWGNSTENLHQRRRRRLRKGLSVSNSAPQARDPS